MTTDVITALSDRRYHALDGMRGIAAIAVMVAHLTMHSDFPAFPNMALAVDLFFILSGFVIAHSYKKRLLTNMRESEYIQRRIIRLYPMFIVGAFLGAPILYFLTKAGLSDFNNREIIQSFSYNAFFIPYLNDRGVNNLGSEGPVIGGIFPTNPCLWSLFFEAFASVAFIFLYKLSTSQIVKLSIASYAVLVIVGLTSELAKYRYSVDMSQGWNTLNFIGGFPRVFFGFTCGIFLHSVAERDQAEKSYFRTTRLFQSSYILYLALIIIFAFPFALRGFYPALILAVVAPALVLIGSYTFCENRVEIFIAKWLGWFSYPVYCLHFPIARAIFLAADKLHYSKISAVMATIALTFLTSFVLTRYYEEPVRKLLTNRVRFRTV